jgi:glycosyltransferase involved in cell wall biosynthesis
VERRTILYTGTFLFPIGDAAGARVLGIGKALRACGYDVVFGGGEAQGRPEDLCDDSVYRFQGFEYVPQANLSRDYAHPWRRAGQVLREGKGTVDWIQGYRARGIAAIVGYVPSTPLQLRLRRFARQNSIPLILDINEWPGSINLPGGRFGARHLDSEFRLRWLNKRGASVIAISSFLADYYERAGCRVVRVPPLVDLQDPKWNEPASVQDSGKPLRLIYAGSPGNKDLLGSIVAGLRLYEGGARAVELHLVGVTNEEARRLYGCDQADFDGTRARVICHGRVAQTEVPRMLADSDFSVLLRPDKRYAHAGFPTKLAESLSAGTPAIVNATSDIAEYVRDGREGLIVQGYSPEAFAVKLREATVLPRERILTMKHLAKDRARELFDYHSYCPALHRFLQECANAGARGTAQ